MCRLCWFSRFQIVCINSRSRTIDSGNPASAFCSCPCHLLSRALWPRVAVCILLQSYYLVFLLPYIWHHTVRMNLLVVVLACHLSTCRGKMGRQKATKGTQQHEDSSFSPLTRSNSGLVELDFIFTSLNPVCLSVWVCVYGGRDNSSFTIWVLGIESGCLAWQPAEPSSQPSACGF